MKLTTVQNITNDQWRQQAERFSSISDSVNSLTFPKKGVDPMYATIEMNVVQPLSQGFRGRVTYKQYFTEMIVTQEEILNDGEPTGTFQDITTPVTRSHIVVDYYEILSRSEVNSLISYVIQSLPDSITEYLDIQDWCIQQAFINQVVSKLTFGGLQATDYSLTP
jgi:hypothetical protein